MPLASYFSQPTKQLDALRAYGSSAKSFAWSIPHKIELYQHTRVAFGWDMDNAPTAPPSATVDQERAAAYQFIYDQLSGYWQVFRPHGREQCWAPTQIRGAIGEHFTDFHFNGSVTLPNLLTSGKHHSLMFSLMAMEGIKPTNSYPTMTVSKFMHFYNPSLFVIYD